MSTEYFQIQNHKVFQSFGILWLLELLAFGYFFHIF